MSSADIKGNEQLFSKKRKVYIYAQVDIDKAFHEIISKSKKIQNFIESHHLDFNFYEIMRNNKNFRICFDHQIQQLIHKKQLSADLRLIKKNAFLTLEDFIIERFKIYLQEQKLHDDYEEKLSQIQEHFTRRIQELTKSLEDP